METKIIDYPKGTTDYSIGDIVFLNLTKKNKVKFIGLDEKGSFLYEPIENTDYFINEKGLIHFTKKVKVYNKEIKMERKDSIEIPVWVLKEIENTLRMASNIHEAPKRDTCFKRCIMKSWNFVSIYLSGRQVTNDDIIKITKINQIPE